MKRKYVTEYGLGYMNSYTNMITAPQLMKGGALKAEEQQSLKNSHIYIIAARPAPYFKPDSIKHENDQLSGTIAYRIDGEEHLAPFEGYKWQLEEDAVRLDCKYPFREIRSLNPDGKEVTYMPASHLSNMYFKHGENVKHDLNQYEVLYVGQAIGQGDRSAIDRLKSHSTLQKILAMTGNEYPDKEIMLFMYAFENDQVFTSMDGRAAGADNSDANEDRLMNAIKNPPNKKQKIGMIEAALIRYFQPHYNEIFKIQFPSVKHKTLQSCRDLDIGSLIVEIDSTDLNYYLYSNIAPSRDHHTIKVDLFAADNRSSFFQFTGLKPMPDIISGKSKI